MKYPVRVTTSLTALIAMLLAGCAGMTALTTGQSQADVRAAWGTPTSTGKTAAGERWVYATAPEGRETWLLDFDREGHLQKQVQGLTYDRVSGIREGQTQADVEAAIGPSYYAYRYPFRQEELVHVYRFMDHLVPTCFYVSYGANGVVTSTGMREEPRGTGMPGLARPC